MFLFYIFKLLLANLIPLPVRYNLGLELANSFNIN